MSTRAVINASSAHGERMKVNVMVNEVCRILKNCSVYLKWEEIANYVAYFMKRLQYSGYDQKFRHLILMKALRRYDKRKEEYERTKTMYPKKTLEQRREKREEKQEWYTEGRRYESVMFVEATPGSQLQRRVQELSDRHEVKIKVVERVGKTVKQILQRSDPTEPKKCERPDCVACGGDSKIDCRTSGCIYELKCKDDDRRYRGTTTRSIYARTKEEIRDWANKDDGSPLWKHSQLYHNGEDFDLEVNILGRCYGKPSRRRITEAVLIDDLPDEKSMNNKSEWTYVKLSKVGMV